jgi:hypothetical protein
MAGLQCVCGDVFTASCDIEPAAGCAIAWLLLLMSAVAHLVQCCDLASDSDDDGCETGTMYT